MIATHTMKVNGIVYRAGEEIPSPAEKRPVEKPIEKTVEKPVEKVEKTYTKSDIMTMKAADLRDVASKNGIDNAEEYTGSELKKMLIEKFDL